jgi:hypothetical protein
MTDNLLGLLINIRVSMRLVLSEINLSNSLDHRSDFLKAALYFVLCHTRLLVAVIYISFAIYMK